MQAGERDRLERPGRYALRPIAEEQLRFDSDYHEGLAQVIPWQTGDAPEIRSGRVAGS